MRDVLRRLAAALDSVAHDWRQRRKRCAHAVETVRCDPPACTRCGATSRVMRD